MIQKTSFLNHCNYSFCDVTVLLKRPIWASSEVVSCQYPAVRVLCLHRPISFLRRLFCQSTFVCHPLPILVWNKICSLFHFTSNIQCFISHSTSLYLHLSQFFFHFCRKKLSKLSKRKKLNFKKKTFHQHN